MASDRLAVVKFEDLTADPVAIVEKIYRQFGLPDFETLTAQIGGEVPKRAGRPAPRPSRRRPGRNA